ncbi:antitoxin MazE family protein [Jannaschia sp. LMIT008]|uniref:antitoxin MazE family protein n=1 Tax=Jannaschia maritima TaxID=3032585 RepID=UPI0028111E61|nr:antitoxin MazE family protein [Jannaschia sp. LMIT008]
MPVSNRDRVAKRRAALRAQGLRPVQIWVPDTRAPGFGEEAARQMRVLRDDPHEAEITEWIAAIYEDPDWDWDA